MSELVAVLLCLWSEVEKMVLQMKSGIDERGHRLRSWTRQARKTHRHHEWLL